MCSWFYVLFLLSFSVSPMIWIPDQLLGAPEGTDVKLECHIESSPRAIAYWNFNVRREAIVRS